MKKAKTPAPYIYPDGTSKLTRAALSGSLDQIKKDIQKKGYDVNEYDRNGYFPLLMAAQYGHISIINCLLELKADINQVKNPEGLNAIDAVIESKLTLLEKQKIIQLLIDKKIQIKGTNLIRALLSKNYAIAELLFKAKPDIVNHANDQGKTPLNVLTYHNHESGVEWLLEHKADPTIPNNQGVTPLAIAASRQRDEIKQALLAASSQVHPTVTVETLFNAVIHGKLSLLTYCIEQKVDVNALNSRGENALICAIMGRQTEIAIALLEHHANPNYMTSDGTTPLLVAASRDNAKLIHSLLLKGAFINHTSRSGYGALLIAVHYQNTNAIQALLTWQHPTNVLDINAQTPAGLNALMCAIAKKNLAITRQLLAHPKIAVNATNQFGKTALMIASNFGLLEIVKLLLAHHAPVDYKTEKGGSALLEAAFNGYTEVIQVLCLHGADINQQDSLGATPLLLAILNGHLKAAEKLLSLGANPNCVDVFGQTPLMVAAAKGNDAIVSLLLEHSRDIDQENGLGLTARHLAKHYQQMTVLAAYERHDNLQILKQFHQESIPSKPTLEMLAKYFQKNKITIALAEPSSLRILPEDKNKELVLEHAEVIELFVCCHNKSEIHKIYFDFIQQKLAVREKRSEEHMLIQLELFSKRLSVLEEKFEQQLAIPLLAHKDLLEKLQQSNKFIQSGKFLDSAKIKVESNYQKNSDLKKYSEKLFSELMDCQEKFKTSCAARPTSLQEYDVLYQQVELLLQQIDLISQKLTTINHTLQKQHKFEARCLKEYENEQLKDKGVVIKEEKEISKKKKKSAKLLRKSKQSPIAPKEPPSRPVEESAAAAAAALPVSPPKPKAVALKEEKKEQVSVSSYDASSGFFRKTAPSYPTLGDLQLEYALKAHEILSLIIGIISQIDRSQAPIPDYIVKNAILGTCAQLMEALKHVKGSLNIFTDEKAKQFRNVSYHAQELFLDQKAEVTMEAEVINMAIEIIKAGTQTKKSKEYKIDSPLYVTIQEYKITDPSLELCVRQLQKAEQELLNCDRLEAVTTDLKLTINAARQFAIAKLGATTAKIRDIYPDKFITLPDRFKKYLPQAAQIRHGEITPTSSFSPAASPPMR